jgi:hypothetical protein
MAEKRRKRPFAGAVTERCKDRSPRTKTIPRLAVMGPVVPLDL